jgi:MoxR-like ATPase
MDPSLATQHAIAITLQTGRVPYIEGGPGEGKTSYITSVAKALDAYFHIEIGSIADPLDMKGQPFIVDGKLRYQPAFYWEEANAAKRSLILFDELPNSPAPVQAAMLTVLQDRRVGAYKLGEHVWFAAAGNPIVLCPNGTPLFAPMANRMVHFKWPFNVDAWRQGMLAGWPAPQFPRLSFRRDGHEDDRDWRDNRVKAVALVTGFSQFRASFVSNMPKGENEQAGAWPSPRSWDVLADVTAAAMSVNADKDILSLLASGCVGHGAGTEFVNWMDKLDLQDPEELLKKPKLLNLDKKRGDLQFATLGAVAGAVIANMTPGRYKNGWLVLVEAQNQKAGDVACAAAQAMAKARKPGCQIPTEAAVFFPLLKAAGLLADAAS